MTIDKTHNESVSDVGVDAEVKIVAIKTSHMKICIDPVDPNPVSIENPLTMSNDHVEEKPHVDPPQLTPSKKEPVLITPSCASDPQRVLVITPVEYSRDQLLMRKDNIAHFMSVDCEISTPICQQLVDLEMINIERLRNEPIGVGAVVQTNLSTGKIIY